jgi:hypothetical protein
MFSLDEIKEVRNDVFAKAETVKTLGEEIADLTAFNGNASRSLCRP